MAVFSKANFPVLSEPVMAMLAPVLVRPILGSPEQYIVAVAAVGKGAFHLQRANKLSRLECLFGNQAALDLKIVITAAVDALENDLSVRGLEALREYQQVFSGVGLGELREVEGRSLHDIACLWLAQTSSLYEDALQSLPEVIKSVEKLPDVSAPREQLPILVMDYVMKQRPDLLVNFDRNIRHGTVRRRGAIHGVIIDYSGRKLAANFDALLPEQHAASVNRIKRRLWDLKIARDSRDAARTVQSHEIFVQHPAREAVRTRRAADRMFEALAGLEEQADKEEIRFRPVSTADEIGVKIIEVEQQAA